ncbi:response regulator [Neptuniibacter sp. CAU 1671]|uniref:response regulator n=1 Tax=Neptuniibacter sp. CAU 1671 TaxID=3032593 RepID=UPI0023DB231E|nr:response regulator [Neptuniibacter sp. CAU 1671]MDF2182315.1 response regulator [Neptuniibacter sp. CAU 1671]
MAEIKVLVVDDARLIREHVSRIVKNHFPDYQVDAAEDGEVARNLMTKLTYDLILCDWEMPGMSGLEVLQWARQQPQYRDVPFVMITSRGERDYVLKAIQAGVNDYMGKPFEDASLVEKITKFAGKRIETSAESRRKAAQMLAAGKSAAGQVKPQKKPLGLVQLRVAVGLLKCALKDVTLQHARLALKREDGVPALLEQVVLDIEFAPGKVVQLNGFISGLNANELRIDTQFIGVDVQFADTDPEKLEQLTRFIATLQKQKKA